MPESILAGDVISYRQRMVELFAGQLPYFDFAFEHLPLMIVPLAVAWIGGGFTGLPGYAFALAGVSTICLLVTSLVLVGAEDRLVSPGLSVRWLMATVPLMPFLLFRNDPFVIMLTVGGLGMAMIGRERLGFIAVTCAVLAKAWPAAWAVVEWWRGRLRFVWVLSGAFALAVAITLSPAVQSIQDPRGLHTETLVGSVLGLTRSLAGTDLGITTSATAYLIAPAWAPIANFLIGGLIAVWTLRRLRSPFSWPGSWVLTGSLVGAGLLAAPYFSTQYVAWFVPFAAWHRKLNYPTVAISAASLVLIANWHLLFDGVVWWWSLLVGRNLSLLVVVVALSAARVPLQPGDLPTDDLTVVDVTQEVE